MNRVIYFVRNNWLLMVIVLALVGLGYGAYRVSEAVGAQIGAVSAKVADVDGRVTAAQFSLDAMKLTAEEDREKLATVADSNAELAKQLAESQRAIDDFRKGVEASLATKAEEKSVAERFSLAASVQYVDDQLGEKANKKDVDYQLNSAKEDAEAAKKEAATAKWQLKKFKKELAEKEDAAATATAETTQTEEATAAVEPTTASAETGDSATPQTEIKWVRVSFQPAE